VSILSLVITISFLLLATEYAGSPGISDN
jgi:hypothetical protein